MMLHFHLHFSRFAQIQTSNYCKVVQQDTEGVVESIVAFVGTGNLLLFPAVKNFENPLRIDKVIATSNGGTQCRYRGTQKIEIES